MPTHLLNRSIALSVLVPLALNAQAAREHDPVPLKNWPAPLYWQANARELAAAPQAVSTGSAQPAVSSPLVFVAMTPCRVVDTRQGQGFLGNFGPPSLAAGQTRTFPMQASVTCSIPPVAQAYSLNVTVVPPGYLLYLTIYPDTAGVQPAPPNASTLNDPQGTIIANAAIVPAGTDGSGGVDVYTSNPTDLIIDINGYYAPTGDLNANTYLGTGALANNTGDNNTAIGFEVLAANTTGGGNTASGYNALTMNTTGSGNTATGLMALGSNTTGAENSAFGVVALGKNTVGTENTAAGFTALQANTTGSQNTASGVQAMQNSTTGSNNTAMGVQALQNNSTGSSNTAVGIQALQSNAVAINNTAVGAQALQDNVGGTGNTAVGTGALQANTIGAGNTAAGLNSLGANTSGTQNSAYGLSALSANTTGSGNVALGFSSLTKSIIGGNNTAAGETSLLNNTTGGNNTAAGSAALMNNTIGNNNIALGANAAANAPAASSNNIHIGSQGSANDSATIRIGTAGTQTSFFVAGVRGITTGNSDAIPVMIDSNGQLGTVSSSRRFKEDIQDMGDASSGLLRLRPVTFRYRQAFADGSKPLEYGLIAEEVEDIYPGLVAHSADGQIETVKYQVLDAMLLNELQKQAEEIRLLKERLAALEASAQK